MRTLRLLLAVGIPIAAIAFAPAIAFHDEGVAHCNGCHTMHNSQNGAAMNFNAAGTAGGTGVGTGYTDLLLFANKNDVCLNCHAGLNSYHVWADDVMTPGFEHGAGNFVFLEEDNINDAHSGGAGSCAGGSCVDSNNLPTACTNYYSCEGDMGATGTWTWSNAIPGQSGGHTLASGIKGTGLDTYLAAGPGGGFLSVDLFCSSCHDPHGNDGFRLLYKAGQSYAKDSGGTQNWTATIDATGINKFFLFGGDPTETNTNHNAYRAGYSEWCGTCHGNFHAASAALVHPSGEFLDTEQIASYNFYNGTKDCIDNDPGGGDPCGTGAQATAYLAMVPLEDAAGTTAINSTFGATATSKVVCVSCHRAHATSAPDAGRWDFNVTGLAEDGHESASYPMPNPYDEFQRSLCNKCHSQDEFDAEIDFTP